MISAKEITNRLSITFLSYQLSHPKENQEVIRCAKMLDKILIWDSESKEVLD